MHKLCTFYRQLDWNLFLTYHCQFLFHFSFENDMKIMLVHLVYHFILFRHLLLCWTYLACIYNLWSCFWVNFSLYHLCSSKFQSFWKENLCLKLADGSNESHNWAIIYSISFGIAKGLEHLHRGLRKPIIHGNLKSKNILLDRNYQPYISDFGLYLLLNATAGQEMLEASAAEGYKAPELIKMKDASEKTDIYSLGVILLELLSGKEAVNENPTPDEDFYLPNFMRNAVLGHRIGDLFHPNILLRDSNDDQSRATEECILKFFQLALACCSPSPSLRPNIKQVLWKLGDIRK